MGLTSFTLLNIHAKVDYSLHVAMGIDNINYYCDGCDKAIWNIKLDTNDQCMLLES